MLIMALVIEPLRRLHHYLMSISETGMVDRTSRLGGYPPLLDFLNPRASLVVSCLQYYATMLAAPEKVGRLLLVSHVRGCTSVPSWIARWPHDWDCLRSTVLTVTSALHRRIHKYLHERFSIYRLADARLGQVARYTEAIDLAQRPSCCMPFGTARVMVTNAIQTRRRMAVAASPSSPSCASLVTLPAVSAAEVADALMRASFTLYLAAFTFRLSAFAVERQHKFNSDFAYGGRTTYPQLAAASLTRQHAKQCQRWQVDLGLSGVRSEEC